MARYTVEQIAGYADAELTGPSHLQVEKIVYDSRKTFVPQDTMFVAIHSRLNDGHLYLDDLYRKGLRVFMVEKSAGVDFVNYPEAAFIVCEQSITALQKLASTIRQQFSFPVVGITGSNGKTIVKEWLASILGKKYKVGRSPRSFNSQIGVPLSLWMLASDLDVALIEAGISIPGEMKKLEACITPEYGILTNIGQAHQENFQSLEDKLLEKLKLFDRAQYICYNSDDKLVDKVVKKTLTRKKLLSCGRSVKADLRLLEQKNVNGRTELKLFWKEKEYKLLLPFSDTASVENALLCLLFALSFKMKLSDVSDALINLQPVAMRLEQKAGINNCMLIDDAYNSDLTSLELALDFLIQMGSREGLSKTLILSDIDQSGLAFDLLYKEIKRLIAEKKVDRFIGIGPLLYKAMEGRNAFQSTNDFLKHSDINGFSNEAILLKGSRRFSFEHISSVLEARRHKTVLEINLNALGNNIQYFKSKLKPETKLLAMVKAYSYGSGAFEIANYLQHQKVDYLGVAFADEGLELRSAGITLPIIVMNPEVSSFPLMLQYDLEPEIYSSQILEAYKLAAQRQGINQAPIHIKLDTGMNRLGFLPDEIKALIKSLKSQSVLRVASVFSHLAGSDEGLHDQFTCKQIDLFSALCTQLQKGVGYDFIRHILNSAGIERFADAQFEMVRLGIGMYGVSAQNTALQHVGMLKSYVSQLKKVPAGGSIGYGRKGEAQEDLTLAVVPIGYADGYNRHLSNGVGQMVVRGQLAPVIGNICMDMCMLDVTHINDLEEGDEVEIFGGNYTIQKMADALGTIPYEVLTGISRRVKRVYVME